MTDTPADDLKPSFHSDVTVELVKHTASDADVLFAARVSTLGEQSLDELQKDPERSKGLINYLMRDRHGSPFEHNSMTFFISAPIFVFREFMRHRVGWCLPGDARIRVGTGKNGTTKRIADIHRDWKIGVPDSMGRTRRLKSCQNLLADTINLETGLAEKARMVDVFESGVKPILKVSTTNGKVLRCTADHRVWTTEGWVRAGDLSVGDRVGRLGRVGAGERGGIPKRLREGIQIWTTEQRADLIAPMDLCYLCEEKYEAKDLELDHVVPVDADLTKALDVSNLRPACKSCHQRKANGEGVPVGVRRRALRNGVRWEAVVSVIPDGEEMTYDISMPPPHHNFIADGFVVHNSYNEESGRYRELQPVFYVPGEDRKLVQQGRPGKYEFVSGTPEQHKAAVEAMTESYRQSYAAYQEMLAAGVAREVARATLPVGLFSSMYATCNARSLMHFLGLRTQHELAKVPSFPQREIEMVGEKMEAEWARLMPLTYAAFNANGRVAP
ncbi:thymidylate synthase (FAD) [Streptomyces sp. di188]|nr:thymidylate synthase (FAD) [Streptomyces sp. di188]SCD52374.1 thymidylate synthase (FAD) [Streptomyces sp. di50b]